MTRVVLCFVSALSVLSGACAATQTPEIPSGYPRLQARYVEMRDGVRIAIDVWLPDDLESRDKVPAIMRSTRYWRARDIVGAAIEQDSNFQMATTLNEAGYAYVCVDARGTGASFGPGRMR